jgi:hypothetical protein
MSCTTTLAGVTCSFNPATYTADGSNTVLTGAVTISAPTPASQIRSARAYHPSSLLLVAGIFLPFGAVLLVGKDRRTKGPDWNCGSMLFLGLFVGIVCITACGGGNGGGSGQPPPPVSGAVTVVATGSTGVVTQSINLNVTIQ